MAVGMARSADGWPPRDAAARRARHQGRSPGGARRTPRTVPRTCRTPPGGSRSVPISAPDPSSCCSPRPGRARSDGWSGGVPAWPPTVACGWRGRDRRDPVRPAPSRAPGHPLGTAPVGAAGPDRPPPCRAGYDTRVRSPRGAGPAADRRARSATPRRSSAVPTVRSGGVGATIGGCRAGTPLA